MVDGSPYSTRIPKSTTKNRAAVQKFFGRESSTDPFAFPAEADSQSSRKRKAITPLKSPSERDARGGSTSGKRKPRSSLQSTENNVQDTPTRTKRPKTDKDEKENVQDKTDDNTPASQRISKSPVGTVPKTPSKKSKTAQCTDILEETDDDTPLSDRANKIRTPELNSTVTPSRYVTRMKTGSLKEKKPWEPVDSEDRIATPSKRAAKGGTLEIVVDTPRRKRGRPPKHPTVVDDTSGSQIETQEEVIVVDSVTPPNKRKGRMAKRTTPSKDTHCIEQRSQVPDPLSVPLPTIAVSPEEINNAQKRILGRINERHGPTHLIGLQEQYNKLYGLLERTVRESESNSVLLVGNRGTGKTVVVNKVLKELQDKHGASSGTPTPSRTLATKAFFEIRLNGLVQTDDRLALREIVRQLHMEQDMEGHTGSFAECLSFVLSTLRAGSMQSTPVVFILEDIDLFAQHPRQALLYNLFDIAQSSQNPVAVVGVTCRIDFMDLLEKRVKSRFSHRHIFFYPPDALTDFTAIVQTALSIAPDDGVGNKEFVALFNRRVQDILKHPDMVNILRDTFELSKDVRSAMRLFYAPIYRLSSTSPFLQPEDILSAAASQRLDHKTEVIKGLSVLELCLLIAMRHQESRQVDTFNFEMVYDEYREFVQRVSALGRGGNSLYFVKPVALKAFEHLLALEFVKRVEGIGARCPKEYRMVRLVVGAAQIEMGVKRYEGCPEAVVKWAIA
ncbi:uncharacterized protein SPPG_04227 [Spizellomyces punctatus DAOM BR117]|uniref:Uncharacterized protein n=1 Tax=Spizellomyces punctatus (strain DAOM BR117) TaxID=645134 RepID=A0A0L0HI78_SPIPD|nr:uncharacterized protein SPPG_04227 [Spizellomyces punctatus DAOM BR117]KND01136.1 hypothetical protein SPPG_04227 [Spizellomyces punctatus DAOM BR117]|eukprot:XP_016609175.1 hypothetical protein SPPG_04227 [Spizellomyces punctatus DAOM BR117]